MSRDHQLTLVEPPLRIELQAHAAARGHGETGAYEFQRWLDYWRTAGTHRVYVATDRSHAIAVPDTGPGP